MHYYRFNIGDYRRKTGHLSLLEHGIYRVLLDTYYLSESPLVADDANLMRLHSIRTEDEKQAFKNIIEDFFICKDGHYFHHVCDGEIERYHEKSQKAKESAEARWGKPKEKQELRPDDANAMRTDSEGNANGMRLPCEQDANHLTINHLTTNQEPITINNKKPFVENSAEFQLAKLLSDLILINNPGNKSSLKSVGNNYQKWADEVRKMMQIDNREFKQIMYLIKWSQKDSFWASNILSPKKLRSKFDTLIMQVKKGENKKQNNKGHSLESLIKNKQNEIEVTGYEITGNELQLP